MKRVKCGRENDFTIRILSEDERQISREEREAEAQRRFEMKQGKKKEKRRGH